MANKQTNKKTNQTLGRWVKAGPRKKEEESDMKRKFSVLSLGD